MFLNQTQPRSLVAIVKDYISEGTETIRAFAPQGQIPTSKSTHSNINSVHTNRIMEIDHKRTMIGLGCGDWK